MRSLSSHAIEYECSCGHVGWTKHVDILTAEGPLYDREKITEVLGVGRRDRLAVLDRQGLIAE